VSDHGQLLYGGPAASFLATGTAQIVLSPLDPTTLSALVRLAAGEGYPAEQDSDNAVIHVEQDRARQVSASLNQAAAAAGILLAEVHVRQPSLEAHYLNVVAGAGR
jgi:hypothetical protein